MYCWSTDRANVPASSPSEPPTCVHLRAAVPCKLLLPPCAGSLVHGSPFFIAAELSNPAGASQRDKRRTSMAKPGAGAGPRPRKRKVEHEEDDGVLAQRLAAYGERRPMAVCVCGLLAAL